MRRKPNPPRNQVITRLAQNRDKFLYFLRQRVPDEQVAEDILQQSFVRAMETSGEIRNKETVIGWFYRVLQNAVIDYYRHRGATKRKIEALEREIAATQNQPPPEELKNDVCQCMKKLLPGLKPEYAELVQRVDLKEEDPKQLAKKLGLTSNNLTVKLHRARQALKKSLQKACGSCAEHGCLNCSCNH